MISEKNLWRTIRIHGQPPRHTLITLVSDGDIKTVYSSAAPAYPDNALWRLADLPSLDQTEALPEPEPSVPKFSLGDTVSCGCGSCDEFDTIVGRDFIDGEWLYEGVIEEEYEEGNLTLVTPPKFKLLDSVKYGEKVYVVDTEPYWESRTKGAGWYYRLGFMDAHECLLEPVSPVLPIERKFTNEHGNEILLVVNEEDGWVTINSESPTSRIEHMWTPKEAAVLLEALTKLNPGGRG